LFSLVSMIGVGIRRKFQQGTVLASSSGSGPEMPINTAPALGDNVNDRREVMQALAGAVAGAVVMPQVAMADGAVSTATIQRARGIYGGRIAGLKTAVSKGDFAAVESEKNAFILFNSGAYRTNSPKAKAEKAATVAAYEDVLAAVNAKDAGKLKSSYAAYVKAADIDINPKPVDQMTGQGYSNDYDWKVKTDKGVIYQR